MSARRLGFSLLAVLLAAPLSAQDPDRLARLAEGARHDFGITNMIASCCSRSALR